MVASFTPIYDTACKRKGGPQAVEALLARPKSPKSLAAIPDDRWLADMTRSVFQAGFSWKVIERKWDGFEAAFEEFNPTRWAFMSDEDLDGLLRDTRIVRNAAKIISVRDNAIFLEDLAEKYGSAGAFFAASPPEDYANLLLLLKKQASRLGGTSGQYFLRRAGVDGYILSRDVIAALVAAGIVDKAPSSQKAMAVVQNAFNIWMTETGRSLTELSRILALSTDG